MRARRAGVHLPQAAPSEVLTAAATVAAHLEAVLRKSRKVGSPFKLRGVDRTRVAQAFRVMEALQAPRGETTP